jgi:hypothetical protein
MVTFIRAAGSYKSEFNHEFKRLVRDSSYGIRQTGIVIYSEAVQYVSCYN